MSAAFIDKGPVMDWTMDTGVYSRYKLWRQRCELLLSGPMAAYEEEVKCKYVLFWAGQRGLEVYNSWLLSEAESKVLDNYWTRFEAYVKPSSNELIAAYELRNMKQGTDTLEEYISKMKTLVIEAGYPVEHHDRFMRDYLVFGMNSDRARKECFKEGSSLTFARAREIAKADESAETQMRHMQAAEAHMRPTQVDAVKHQPKKQTPQLSQSTTNIVCKNCFGRPHNPDKCPAKHAKCYKCQTIGHFARTCEPKKRVQSVEVQSSSTSTPDSFLGPIKATPLRKAVINVVADKDKALIQLNISARLNNSGQRFLSKIDSGAEANVIPIDVWEQLQGKSKIKLGQPNFRLEAYGGSEIPNRGSSLVYVRTPARDEPFPINVEIAGICNAPVIIGNITAQQIGLLKLMFPIDADTNTTKVHCKPLTKEYILKEYEDVFSGIGRFPGPEHHIIVDESIEPVQHPPRQVPVHIQAKYKAQLDKLEKDGIISRVENEYSPWVNSVVITEKPNGDLRVCLDPRDLNKAIRRNQHYMKTIDDVIPYINGSRFFTIVDARSGYWQVPLDAESSKLCTFNTPWGKYAFKRLPFGLSSSGDVFQERMDSMFGGMEGVKGIVDDVILYAGDEATHDRRMIEFLERARLNNVKLNPDKFQFKVQEASFFGLKWTPSGITPDRNKISAIVDMKPPQNVSELRSLMGMINYLNRFSPVLAHASEPLRHLLKADVPFVWQIEQDVALEEIKTLLTNAPLLCYFDPEKQSVIQSDASLKGLGCVLLQEGKPVCYASRSLTDAEKNYSNIERELLAACWSLEKLHHYVYGHEVRLETDHKPLESIWKKPISKASPRLQRLLLRMSKYKLDVRYISGKCNAVADALSRISSMASPDPCQSDFPTIAVDTITSGISATPLS